MASIAGCRFGALTRLKRQVLSVMSVSASTIKDASVSRGINNFRVHHTTRVCANTMCMYKPAKFIKHGFGGNETPEPAGVHCQSQTTLLAELTSPQTTALTPNELNHPMNVDYPWLYGPAGDNQPWKVREDQYLFDAMVMGKTYADISRHLSRGLIKRSEKACRKRIEHHTTWENGGHLLPKQWDWTEKEVTWHRKSIHQRDTALTLEEFEEIVLFKGRGMHGLNPGIFRDQRSAVRPNKETKNLDNLNPRLIQTAIVVLSKRRKESGSKGEGRGRRRVAAIRGVRKGRVSSTERTRAIDKHIVTAKNGGMSFKEIQKFLGLFESVPIIENAYQRAMQKSM